MTFVVNVGKYIVSVSIYQKRVVHTKFEHLY